MRRSLDVVRQSIVGKTEADKKADKEREEAEEAARKAEVQRKNIEKWNKQATNEDVLAEMFQTSSAKGEKDPREIERERLEKKRKAEERAKHSNSENLSKDTLRMASTGWAHMKRATKITGQAALALKASLWVDDETENANLER